MALTLLIFDGAGTKGLPPEDPRSILTPLIARLRWRTGCTVHRPEWAASLMGVGGSKSWPVATRHAVLAAAEHMRATEGDFIVVGYSAGCRPARELLEQHPDLADRTVALGLVADPWQPATRNQHGVPNPPGFGIMGSRLGPIPSKTYFVGADGDPICRASWDSLLRYITASADAVPGGLILAFLDHAARGRLQLIPFLGLPLHEWWWGLGERIDRSVREARGYLTGAHTTAYTRPHPTPDGRTDSLVHRLADSIAWSIRNRA